MRSITFLMPGSGRNPAGGYKVVYEYANRFVEVGYEVHIVYSATLGFKSLPFKDKIRAILRYIYWAIIGFGGRSWFGLNPRIKEHLRFSLNYANVPKTDFYVATAVQTSYYGVAYPIDDSKKLYLIQDFENWGVSEEYVYQSYRLGLKNIVISNWLAKKVEYAGAKCSLIKNGFDFDYFNLKQPIESRSQYVISMLYNSSERKGCKYGVEALYIVKAKYPQLEAIFFGTPRRPDNLPQWIEYYRCPDKETHNYVYNKSSIYLAPSLQEGWGLTVGEAMICGNAIVCTDTLGFQEMVTNGKEGLIVPSKNALALAEAMKKLIENPDRRIMMAQNAVKTISDFTWESSFKLFESLLTDC